LGKNIQFFTKYRMSNLSILTVSVFNTNGTWIKPADTKAVDILIIGGGGGGGGGGVGRFSADQATGGNGGNSGNVFFLKKYPSYLLNTNISVSIGSGGSAGAGAATTTTISAQQAGTGGTSTFGTFIALGGYGGRVGARGNTQIIMNTQPLISGMYNYTSDFYLPMDGLRGAQSDTGTNQRNPPPPSVSYFNLATGGGIGDEWSGTFENDTPSGYIYNPFLIYGTAVSITDNSIPTTILATTFNLYYGTGGAGAPFGVGPGTAIYTIVTGLSGTYGGGGGGGISGNDALDVVPGAGGFGGTGVVVVTSYG